MPNGGGQFTELRAVTSTGAVSPLALCYHYEEGVGTVDKDIYSDADLSTPLAQPFVADTAGRFHFYAQGDFKFIIKTAAGATLDTWDEYHISMGQPFITDFGDTLPSATSANQGQGFALIQSSILRQFVINQFNSWVTVYKATAAGDQTFDTLVAKSHPWYDITHGDYGAIAGEAADQGARIRLAISAIEAAGKGVLLIPEGRFQVDSILDIVNSSITILGMGPKSVLVQTSSPSGALVDFDSNDTTDTFVAMNFRIETSVGSVTSGDHAFDLTWNDSATFIYPSNCLIDGVSVTPTDVAKATSGFDYFVQIEDGRKPIINNCEFRGHTGGTMEGQGIRIIGDTNRVSIANSSFSYLAKGVLTGGTADKLSVLGIDMSECTKDFELGVAGSKVHIMSSELAANDDGIECTATLGTLKVSDCEITKHSGSTEDYTGITVDCSIYHITGNTIEDDGSASGTDIGISVTTGTAGIIDLNIMNGIRTTGVNIAAGISGFNVSNNRINTSVTGINVAAGASDNYIITNNNLEGTTTSLSDGGTGTDKVIANNTPMVLTAASVASATTITGPDYTDFWSITGTTTIDNVTASWIGRKITLLATSSFDVRDGVGNLDIVQGGGSFSMVANDTLSLGYNGTKWYEIGRGDNP